MSNLVTPDMVDRISRAFWRRIEPHKADFDKELPAELPVEFKSFMATALSQLTDNSPLYYDHLDDLFENLSKEQRHSKRLPPVYLVSDSDSPDETYIQKIGDKWYFQTPEKEAFETSLPIRTVSDLIYQASLAGLKLNPNQFDEPKIGTEVDGADQYWSSWCFGGVLYASIGVNLVKASVEHGLSERYGQDVAITDLNEFCDGLTREIVSESPHNGATPLHIMLDDVAAEYIEQGGAGVQIEED